MSEQIEARNAYCRILNFAITSHFPEARVHEIVLISPERGITYLFKASALPPHYHGGRPKIVKLVEIQPGLVQQMIVDNIPRCAR